MKQKCSKIPFNKDFRVYVIENDERGVEWVSLYDLCRILRRSEMYESGEATGLCPSCKGFPVYGNGKLFKFINIYDVHVLLRAVRKENRQAASICDDIEKWVAALPMGKNRNTERLPASRSVPAKPPVSPVTFTFREQPVSFMADNGKTFFNATQMARSFGKSPREWLSLAETVRFRQSLVNQRKSESMERQIMTVRGSAGATWIEDSLGLEFSRWLSPEFSEWCNERVKELVTKGYVTLKKCDEERFPVPTTFKEALLLAASQQEVIERQQQKIEEDRPKVVFYNDFIESREYFKSSIIAEELQITTMELHRFLIEQKICKYEKRRYVVYPSHSALQCDYPYLWTNRYGKTYAYSHGKRWTKAGREYILDLYRNLKSMKNGIEAKNDI
jgi:phage antirepressor YoqD-like protein/prophage antirepressor-like protein